MLNKQLSETYKKMCDNITALTGIESQKLESVVEEHGLLFVLENPKVVDTTKAKTAKLLKLIETLKYFRETEFLKETTMLNSTTKSGDYFVTRLSNVKDKELFEVCFLNTQNQVIATKTVHEGTLTESPVYPREIIKLCLDHNANSVILAHNHPGGSLRASGADIEVTRRIKRALDTISIHLIDHIIVADDRFLSFAEQGMIDTI